MRGTTYCRSEESRSDGQGDEIHQEIIVIERVFVDEGSSNISEDFEEET